MRSLKTWVWAILCLIVSGGVCMAASSGMRLNFLSGGEARIFQNESGAWIFQSGAESYELSSDKAGLVFKRGSSILARGKDKGGKVILSGENGLVYPSLKISPDKIKITTASSPTPWEIKFKSGKVKIVYGGVEYGKVKYYGDTGKIKAKDRQGNAVVEMRGMGNLTAAPGIFLIESLPREQAVLIFLYLLSAGR